MPDFVELLPTTWYDLSNLVSELINNDLAEAGGPTKSRCTGLSALMDMSNSPFTSSKPTMLSNNPRLCPMAALEYLLLPSSSETGMLLLFFLQRLNNLISFTFYLKCRYESIPFQSALLLCC